MCHFKPRFFFSLQNLRERKNNDMKPHFFVKSKTALKFTFNLTKAFESNSSFVTCHFFFKSKKIVFAFWRKIANFLRTYLFAKTGKIVPNHSANKTEANSKQRIMVSLRFTQSHFIVTT